MRLKEVCRERRTFLLLNGRLFIWIHNADILEQKINLYFVTVSWKNMQHLYDICNIHPTWSHKSFTWIIKMSMSPWHGVSRLTDHKQRLSIKGNGRVGVCLLSGRYLTYISVMFVLIILNRNL